MKSDYDSIVYLDSNDNNAVEDKYIILTRDEADVVKEKFYKETESAYLQAKRDQVNCSCCCVVALLDDGGAVVICSLLFVVVEHHVFT